MMKKFPLKTYSNILQTQGVFTSIKITRMKDIDKTLEYMDLIDPYESSKNHSTNEPSILVSVEADGVNINSVEENALDTHSDESDCELPLPRRRKATLNLLDYSN